MYKLIQLEVHFPLGLESPSTIYATFRFKNSHVRTQLSHESLVRSQISEQSKVLLTLFTWDATITCKKHHDKCRTKSCLRTDDPNLKDNLRLFQPTKEKLFHLRNILHQGFLDLPRRRLPSNQNLHRNLSKSLLGLDRTWLALHHRLLERKWSSTTNLNINRRHELVFHKRMEKLTVPSRQNVRENNFKERLLTQGKAITEYAYARHYTN